MQKVGKSLYCNFQVQRLKKQRKKVRGLIMGACGCGKTSFINNACQKNHRTGIAKGSLTRDIVYQDVAYLPEGVFRIYDTPGTTSFTNALGHAQVLRASITSHPFNIILIQSKFQSRFQKNISQLKKHVKLFKNYKQYVVFMISNIDQLQRPQHQSVINSTLQQFGKELKYYGIDLKVILYSNTTSDFQKLTSILYDLACQRQQAMIKINDQIFFKHFNISTLDFGLNTESVQGYIDQIKQSSDQFIKFLKNLQKDTPDIDNIISESKLYMKNYLKNLQDKQYQQYSESLKNDYLVTDTYLMISQIIQTKLEIADQICSQKTKRSYFDQFFKKQTDIRDRYKQCPKCKLIWVKINGCYDTYCGNKPAQKDYFKNQQLFKYRFNITEKGIQITKGQKFLPPKLQQTQKMEQNNSTGFFQSLFGLFKTKIKDKDNQLGCGTKLVWNQLPRLQNIDQILKNIQGISNFEQIKFDLEKMEVEKKQYKKQLDEQLLRNMNIIKNDKL